MLKHTTAALALATMTAAQAAAEAPERRQPLDRTGVDWCLPFAAAQARAAAEGRLIFVPVIAGGTDKTGRW